MKKPTFALIIFILAVAQSSVLNSLRVWNVKPDLLLICAVIAGLFFELKGALLLALLAGLLKDALCGNAFGINTLLFPLWVFLINWLSKKMPLENILLRASLVFIATALNTIFSRLINFSLESQFSIWMSLRVLILESVYTAAVSALIFRIAR